MNFSIGKLTGREELGCAALAANSAKKRMTQKVLGHFLAPHPSPLLPVPLSFSLISLEAGVGVREGRRDHFAQ